MAVIKDVAGYAGLSVSAVSKYLKDPMSVRPDTRACIERAIRDLRYVPSSAARSLRTGLTNLLYVISPNITNPFFAQLFRHLQTAAYRHGYTAVLQTLDMVRDSVGGPEPSRLPGSAGLHVDGIIVCFPDDEAIVSDLQSRWNDTPTVYLTWKPLDNLVRSAVLMDVEDAIYIAARHLLSVGYRRLAYVGAPVSSITSREKFKGCLKALAEAGLTVAPQHVFHGPYGMETGCRAAEIFLSCDSRPECVLTESDEFAIGFIKECAHAGVRVPEDVAVVGFDDIPIASMYEPPLTTLRLPLRDMAASAVERVLGLVESKSLFSPDPAPVFNAELILRESTRDMIPHA